MTGRFREVAVVVAAEGEAIRRVAGEEEEGARREQS
jgi:hypothetical protein